MAEIVQLGSAEGSFLMSIDYYRRPDGEIVAVLHDMPIHIIESQATISARFTKAAEWALGGVISLMRQAVRFDEEVRQAENDIRREGD
jgi:hypothetical protein